MNYDYAVSIVDSQGWDEFLQILQKRFKVFNLYCVSQDWYWDDQYICKARGTRGDVVVYWEHKCSKVVGD
jgi:hypothetical protein